MKDNAQAIRADELPMERHHLLAEDAILKRRGKIQNCFRSAFRHIRLSWRLHPIDSEMSMFRAITGEEEAATGLMLALIQQRYPGARKLNPKDHRHKAAITPYLDAVNNAMASVPVPAPKLSLSTGKHPQISISIDLFALGLADKPTFATPDHPFNFSLKKNDEKNVYFFEKELLEIASVGGAASIKQAVAERANIRNRLLYASDKGIPNVEFPDETLLRYRDRIYRLCLIAIGILQTKQHQLFAAQNLHAFLSMLDHVVEDPLDYDAAMRQSGPLTSIVQQQTGEYRATVGYRANVDISGQLLPVLRGAAQLDEKENSVALPTQPENGIEPSWLNRKQ